MFFISIISFFERLNSFLLLLILFPNVFYISLISFCNAYFIFPSLSLSLSLPLIISVFNNTLYILYSGIMKHNTLFKHKPTNILESIKADILETVITHKAYVATRVQYVNRALIYTRALFVQINKNLYF